MADDVDQVPAWNWRGPSAAAALGVIQISAGVVLQASCPIPGVGILLIRQGSGDIAFAFGAGVANNFSWSEYAVQKLISLPFTVGSIGITRWQYGGAANVLRRSVAKVVARQVATVLGRCVVTVCLDKVLSIDAVMGILQERVQTATERVFAQNFVDLGNSLENVFRLSPADADRLVSEAVADVMRRFDEHDESTWDKIRDAAVEFLLELGPEFLARKAAQDFADRIVDFAKFAAFSTKAVAECCVLARKLLTSLKEALDTIVVINAHKLLKKYFI